MFNLRAKIPSHLMIKYDKYHKIFSFLSYLKKYIFAIVYPKK